MSNVFYRAKGCTKCFNTGYRGRLVLSEVLVLTPRIRDLIMNRVQDYVIREAAREEGMQTLREDGLLKARDGITSLEEVLRVTAADKEK